jgi:hypothetical protein
MPIFIIVLIRGHLVEFRLRNLQTPAPFSVLADALIRNSANVPLIVLLHGAANANKLWGYVLYSTKKERDDAFEKLNGQPLLTLENAWTIYMTPLPAADRMGFMKCR